LGRLNTNTGFYDSLSTDYDLMVNASSYISARKEILKRFIKENYRSAADIGCGTGNDAVALALNGLKVTGFEPSADMLLKAKRKSAEYGCRIDFVNAPASLIKRNFDGKFDLVVSLGNALANMNPSELRNSLKRMRAVMKAGGTLLIQLLNYTNLRKENKRIVNVTESGGRIFFRFYDFLPGSLCFNILAADRENLKNHKLISTRLYEYRKNELSVLLKQAGFKNIKYHSDFSLNTFSASSSKDLIITANIN